MCFFAFTAFEVLNTAIDNKPLSDTSVYVNMNTYSDLRRLSSDLYSSIDFFETQRKTGRFSYLNMAALSDITLEYTPAHWTATPRPTVCTDRCPARVRC